MVIVILVLVGVASHESDSRAISRKAISFDRRMAYPCGPWFPTVTAVGLCSRLVASQAFCVSIFARRLPRNDRFPNNILIRYNTNIMDRGLDRSLDEILGDRKQVRG